MTGPCQVKLCGVTRAADVAVALHLGVDWIGVNAWPGSLRHVPAGRRAPLLREIPAERRVAVAVNPAPDEALALLDEGFAAVQAHFDPGEGACDPAALSRTLGPGRLWLAPRLADGVAFPAALLALAETFVHDAHRAGSFGGTGARADWSRFLALQAEHPSRRWILAGGLGPDNAAEAAAKGVRILDLNSQVELAPGLKSAEKLHQVAEALRKIGQK